MSTNICLSVCKKTCCKNVIIPLTHFDIQRIIKHKSIPLHKFIKFYDYTTLPENMYYNVIPVIINDNLYVMSMNILDNEHRLCPFIKNRKCTIYQARPIVCRTYPFTISYPGVITFVNDKRCPCKWDDSHIIEARKLLLMLFEQLRKYHRRVQWWNTYYRGTEFEEFLEYILDDLPPQSYHVMSSEDIVNHVKELQTNPSITPPLSKEQVKTMVIIDIATRHTYQSFQKLRKKKIVQLKSIYNKQKDDTPASVT